MIGLGTLAQPGLFHLDEIAYLGTFLHHRAGAQTRERPDFATRRDGRPLDMTERADYCPVGDLHPGSEHDMRFDRAVAAKFGVSGKPHALRVDQGRALLERFLAPPSLPI